ncbi:MAG: hypothetical protein WBV90_13220, partial [Terrimicrobiaceae bacterium]
LHVARYVLTLLLSMPFSRPAPTRRSGQGVDQGWGGTGEEQCAAFLQWAQKNLSFVDRIGLEESSRTYRDTTRDFER